MNLTEHTIHGFLEALRSPNPTPGGGSASALAGAAGASLLAMVAGLPKSRAVTVEDLERLKAAGERCTALAVDLEALVQRDSDAYDMVLAAYRRPKGTEDEKNARAAAIQSAFRAAIAAPLEVMRACAAGAEQAVVVATLGLASASSDVQVGVELLGAALRGAKLNVETNLGSVKDQEYLAEVRADVVEYERAIGHEASAAVRALSRT
ncbi:MAG TPA: cyclodeaminase/cyclohydrolase family protein [Vicinamibacterales bacterium]